MGLEKCIRSTRIYGVREVYKKKILLDVTSSYKKRFF